MSVEKKKGGAPKGNKNAEGNKGGGNATKYKKEFVKVAKKMCLMGATNQDLADAFGVSESCIRKWIDTHVEFDAAVKSGKKYSDDAVVDSLYNRAIGYTLTEEKEEDSEANGKKKVKTVRQVAGDTTAQIFWLKNRRPKEWRDRQEQAVVITDDFDSLMGDAASD